MIYSTVTEEQKGCVELYPQIKPLKISNNIVVNDIKEHERPPPSYNECISPYHLQIKHERVDNIYIQRVSPNTSKTVLQIKTKKSVAYKYLSCRWRVAILALSGLILQIAHRNCISVALVCMTNGVLTNVTMNGTVVEKVHKEYDWTTEMEGVILSSYFYGQIISPLISGILCRHFGVRGPMALYVSLSSCLLFLTPLLADHGAWTLILVRSAQGFFGSGCLPMYSHLWSKWAPKQERSQLIAFTFAGLDIGVIVAFTVSGWLCTLSFGHGWPLIFYVFGIISIVWCAVWLYYITDNPEDNHYITEGELKYILCERQSTCSNIDKKHLKTPWLKILTSGPVFAMVTGMFTVAWGMTVVFSFLPKYMNDVLKYNIQQNGFLSSLPFLGRSISIILVGKMTDALLNHNIFRVTTMRKINQCGAGILGAAFIIPVGFMSEGDSLSAILLITLSSMALGSAMSGAYSNILEIFPMHASTISGVAFAMNGIGQISAPVIIGKMIVDGSRNEWVYVFISIGVVYLVGAIVYGILGSARPADQSVIEVTIDADTFTETDKQTGSAQKKIIETDKAVKYSLSNEITPKEETVYTITANHSTVLNGDKPIIYSIEADLPLAQSPENSYNL